MTTREEAVEAVLKSGIRPLELTYQPIHGCETMRPIAYRTASAVSSLDLGVLTPHEYSYATDTCAETGIRLAKWNIRAALEAIEKFTKAGRHVQFLSVRCPAALADTPGLYEFMKETLAAFPNVNPSHLCLEFPPSLLYLSGETVRTSIMDMKLLHVQTMLSGCGAEDCPIMKLLTIPVDAVLLDPATTALNANRDKDGVLPSLLTFLLSLHVDVYAEGVANDEELRFFQRHDVLGATLLPTYDGRIPYVTDGVCEKEAIAQKEEEEAEEE